MKFRRLPIVVEAVRCKELEEIVMAQGIMLALPGDWIITGVAGEMYPCKDEIFRQTHEPIDVPSLPPNPRP